MCLNKKPPDHIIDFDKLLVHVHLSGQCLTILYQTGESEKPTVAAIEISQFHKLTGHDKMIVFGNFQKPFGSVFVDFGFWQAVNFLCHFLHSQWCFLCQLSQGQDREHCSIIPEPMFRG